MEKEARKYRDPQGNDIPRWLYASRYAKPARSWEMLLGVKKPKGFNGRCNPEFVKAFEFIRRRWPDEKNITIPALISVRALMMFFGNADNISKWINFIEPNQYNWRANQVPVLPDKDGNIYITSTTLSYTIEIIRTKDTLDSWIRIAEPLKEYPILKIVDVDSEEERQSAEAYTFSIQPMGPNGKPFGPSLHRTMIPDKVAIRRARDWGNFLLKYPDARDSCKDMPKVYAELGGRIPASLKEFRNIVEDPFNYGDTSGYEELARLCRIYKIHKNDYYAMKTFMEEHSQPMHDSMPDIRLEKDGYIFRKMQKRDIMGLFLGYVTDCCQYIGGSGGSCVKHGWNSEHGAFYVLEKDGRIVAQSWAWKEGRDIVFDSVELIKDVTTEQISYAVWAWLTASDEIVRGRIHRISRVLGGRGSGMFANAVWIGNVSTTITRHGGKFYLRTKKIHEVRSPAKLKGYDGYTDARTQLLLAKSRHK